MNSLYTHSLALLTDLYQLTMAYGYWKADRGDQDAVFHLHFRKNPFEGGYSIACGLFYAVQFLDNYRFEQNDLEYLSSLTGNDGKPLFEQAFLDYLGKLKLTLDIDAVPEGTAVFPQEPLFRVTGPIIQGQLLETTLLNLINFQTLIATKASRVVHAARGDAVLEFGLRRAQGIDGGLAASRASYVGGCAATSNVLAGKLFGIPVRGTHAHSWVMSFDDELEAFEAYARALPNNVVFLVDTYDTLEGVRRAVEVGKHMRARGNELIGVRLDSGDLAWLSIEARKILDEGGFPDAHIFASNDLDETIIQSLKDQGARIGVWGVGTKLATAYDQPAMGGVYKLGAVREKGGPWKDRIKLSEQAIKISTPGQHQVRRFHGGVGFTGDAIWDLANPPASGSAWTIVDPLDHTRRKRIPEGTPYTDLLVPIYRGGKRVYDPPAIDDTKRRTAAQVAGLHEGIRRLMNPHQYPVGLELGLFERKTRLILEARGLAGET